MIKIYHNPRCSKSRQGVQFLEEQNQDFEVVKYLNDIPTKAELIEIIGKLGVKPIDLVRVKEQIWKDNFKGKDLSDTEIVQAMIENPRLIERPIIINGNKAIIGRPTEKILDII
ncbi:MAG: arsenate reductase (glutaredoxin) [Polaribacter sp.]|nr:MAG: arsenate reductase (glutaredoxin) [Polaribacter sp.]